MSLFGRQPGEIFESDRFMTIPEFTYTNIQEQFRRRSRYLMGAAMSVAVIGLLGWKFDVGWIKHPLPQMIAMNPLSSVCFLAAGASFFLFRREAKHPLYLIIAYALATVPILIGLIRIAEIAVGFDFDIDRILFYKEFQLAVASNLSNHIALNTAFNFILIGIILIFSRRHDEESRKFSDAASMVIILLAVFAIVGHFYGVKEYFGILSYLPVAILTATGLLLIGFAFIFANAGNGLLKVMFSPNTGGTTARILIPAGILIPFLLGYMRLFIQWKFPVSLELGTSYLITGIILLFFLLIVFTSLIIERNDIRRKEAEQKLVEINAQLEQKIIDRTEEISRNEKFFRALIENSSDAILLTDKNLHATFQSPGAERMTGISLEMRKANPGLRYTHPDELEMITIAHEKVMHNPGIPIGFQSRFLHRDGYYIWIEGVMTNLLHDRNIGAIAFNYRDVTERKKLEERRDLFVSMVNLSDDAIISLSLDGTISTWNQGAGRLYGYSPFEALGMHVSSIIPESEAVRQNAIFVRALNGETIEHYETQRMRKGGTLFYISLSVSPMKDMTGKIIGSSEIGHDISGRKADEERILSSEKRFRALIENITDAIVLNDANSNLLYQSPSVTRILGYSPEERLGTPVLDFVHPDFKQSFIDLYKKLEGTIGIPIPFEYQFRHKKGHYIWLEGFVTNMLHDPNVQAFVANYRDVTERKEYEATIVASENRFRALIENSADGIVLIDERSDTIYRSPAASKIGGFGEDQKTKEVINNTHPDDLPVIRSKFQEAFGKPGIPIAFQGRFMNNSGSYFWLEGTLTNLLHTPGVNAIVTNFHDISERKKAEQEIHDLNLELEEKVLQRTSQLQAVNKELEAFTYSVSHDLRAPLRIINGFSEILIEDNLEALDEKGQKTLGVIVKNAKKMGQLIDDLLEFSRVGRTALRISSIDMNELVQDVLHEIASGGTVLPADLIVHPMSPARGDGSLIKVVWTNLLSNAIKYSSRKAAPRIEIGSTKGEQPVEYYVNDNGAGFDMLYKDKLFGVFQRLHKQEEFPGTGVGLALVQRVVVRHGGTIRAEAELDKGATFYFSLGANQ